LKAADEILEIGSLIGRWLDGGVHDQSPQCGNAREEAMNTLIDIIQGRDDPICAA
jgi:hypothetical protein